MSGHKALPAAAAAVAASLLMAAIGGCSGKTTVEDVEDRAVETRALESLWREDGLDLALDPDDRELLLIDARPGTVAATGVIPGAVVRSPSDFPLDFGTDPDVAAFDRIVVYGENPGDFAAKGLVQRLVRLRYRGVRWYRGGIDAWRRAGLPTEAAGGGDG